MRNDEATVVIKRQSVASFGPGPWLDLCFDSWARHVHTLFASHNMGLRLATDHKLVLNLKVLSELNQLDLFEPKQQLATQDTTISTAPSWPRENCRRYMTFEFLLKTNNNTSSIYSKAKIFCQYARNHCIYSAIKIR